MIQHYNQQLSKTAATEAEPTKVEASTQSERGRLEPGVNLLIRKQ